MLNSRIRVLHQYLVGMEKGETPCEDSLLRKVSSLLRRLPTVESENFQDDFLMMTFCIMDCIKIVLRVVAINLQGDIIMDITLMIINFVHLLAFGMDGRSMTTKR